MEPLQILLILTGLAVAVGGVVALFRVLSNPAGATLRPYLAFGMIGVGLLIAYRTYSSFDSLEPLDVVIMFLFVFGLMTLLGLQFFVVDKSKREK